MLAVWMHSLDPWVVRFGADGLGIRWYGLSYVFGFALAYVLIRLVVTRGVSTIDRSEVSDFIFALIVGIYAGGRLGYCLFYKPELLGLVEGFPYWGVLAIQHGGMSSHGGIVGGILACLWWAHRRGHRAGHVLDLMAFAGPLGLFFGRIANFVNGELYGRPVDPSFPLAVKFPQELTEIAVDPERADQIAPLVELFLRRGAEEPPWIVAQIIEAIQRGDQLVAHAVAPILTPRHPSQLYQAVLEGLIVFLIGVVVWQRPRKPWTIAGLFGVTYSLARIVGEFFREPDAHIRAQEFALFQVTRGQLLSVGTLLLGLALLVLATRSDAPRMGGWSARVRR